MVKTFRISKKRFNILRLIKHINDFLIININQLIAVDFLHYFSFLIA